GQISARAERSSRARAAYAVGARYRESSDLRVAASGWLARARELELMGARGVLRSCARGLDALDEYREIMGSAEVRASMTHRGRDLAIVALRHATDDPRALLRWSERWRATSLSERPVTPHGEVSPAVAMLRDSGRLIAEARAAGEPTDALEKERRSLERKVRAEHHQQRAEGRARARRFDPAELVAEVGDAAFIELVDVDGTLHILVVSNGRVRRVIAGETKTALELAEAGRFALRRAARTNRFSPGDLGQRFQDTVLGNAVRTLPDGPVTLSPTAALHGAPFALMPALTNRPFSIVPSAAQWLRAREVPKPRTKRRALVSGPGLLTGGAEVARLAKKYPDATVLEGPNATVEATMKAIDGSKLAHLATHGTFRADSPLFSALELADGPLSVYELERLKRAPYRTILSACDSGVLAPVGAQEVLGLASALFSLGSAGLLCSIAEVNDEVTADLMMDVHATLDAGGTPAEALAAVRNQSDPIAQATAAAFVALGI
ncbi:MAG: CHAT domain-containing protein, partial [Marmoricola sp.]